MNKSELLERNAELESIVRRLNRSNERLKSNGKKLREELKQLKNALSDNFEEKIKLKESNKNLKELNEALIEKNLKSEKVLLKSQIDNEGLRDSCRSKSQRELAMAIVINRIKARLEKAAETLSLDSIG